ncbi:MAG TPA: glycosyltransferase family 39 protein [Leptolyngbyaceae cyanobacterium M65_K2018_010]|nr:glycosyltransferase family 39 protein [Leptolyngbyaceae cyanobacterium M65_K2018_010]
MALGIIAIALGLRFADLDHKVYWHDEVFTSLRVAGYIGPEVTAQLFTDQTLTARELLQYQHFPADASLAKTWMALVDHPEHPPLYYLLAYAWGHIWTASVGAYRALAALFGVLALPLMYGLGRSLFPQAPAIAGLATVLLAVSPVHFIYSQEAREYSLWVVGILLANLTLWRALRNPHWRGWFSYGVALGFTFYGSLMTGLLVLSHLIFVVLTQKPRQWLAFALANGLALGCLAPWLWVIGRQWQRLHSVTAWIHESRPWGFLAQLWGLHYSAVVVDFNLPLDHGFTVVGPTVVLGLVVLALGSVWRSYDRELGLFLGCLWIVSPLVIIGADWINRGQMSSTTRYFLPSLVTVPLILAPWFYAQITAAKPLQRLGGHLLVLGLLGVGLMSLGVNSRALTWWNKSFSYPNPYIAEYLNRIPQPLVVVEPGSNALGDAISLSYHLHPETPLWLLAEDRLPPGLPTTKTIFLLKPTASLIGSIEPPWQVEPVQADPRFAATDLVKLVPVHAPRP